MGRVTAVVGAQWGDEGKGKIVDTLATSGFAAVGRYQGGANAGHTVINNYGRFALHLLPSGVFSEGVVNVLGAGVAVDMAKFLAELQGLADENVPTPIVKISDRAQVLLPHHIMLDEAEEEHRGDKKFGSTKSGIAPFYADMFRKFGVQLQQLFGAGGKEALKTSVDFANELLRHRYGREAIEFEAYYDDIFKLAEQVRPYVEDTGALLRGMLKEEKDVLLEGQLGALRDPLHGIYPFVTSSSTLASYAPVGAGVPSTAMTRVIAVAKAYSSMVGTGIFVSEITDEALADKLRKVGGDKGEFGATTGRPRDVGWFDVVATRYGVSVHGATEVALTNLDVLGEFDEIGVCTGYEIDGSVTKDFPATAELAKAKPVFESLPGWGVPKDELKNRKTYGALPDNARRYVEYVEEQLERPIEMISVGPAREDLIMRNS